jgi:uncharacterized protein YndB with AHSA1/START domain/predicted enzyme related to lactoylglutathione lyase
MSTTATADNITLKLTRFIKAPRERVFEAWTNPEELMRWFGPGLSHLVSAKTDLRPGGEYRLVMNTKGGCNHEGGDKSELADISGVYKEVKKPSRLVFTWGWTNNPRVTDETTTVTIDLMEVQGGTQLTLTHEGFTTEESRDNHNGGWTGAIDKLEQQAEKACWTMTPGNFSWNELITTDVDKAGAFYTKLFGWETVPMPGGMPYTIFKNGSNYAGGMMKCPVEGLPSHWLAYITVESTDASLAAAVKLGAEVCVEPKDIPGVGRIAVLKDPAGAVFGVFQIEKK